MYNSELWALYVYTCTCTHKTTLLLFSFFVPTVHYACDCATPLTWQPSSPPTHSPTHSSSLPLTLLPPPHSSPSSPLTPPPHPHSTRWLIRRCHRLHHLLVAHPGWLVAMETSRRSHHRLSHAHGGLWLHGKPSRAGGPHGHPPTTRDPWRVARCLVRGGNRRGRGGKERD